MEEELFASRNELEARDSLARKYDHIATGLARRFAGRGEDLDDLTQTARLGLVNAIDRFDSDKGASFATFATRTIVGELKRHLRDKAWAVRVPRRLQELSLEIGTVTSEITQKLGRSPTLAEIAEAVDQPLENVVEAVAAGGAYSASSLNRPAGGDEQAPAVIETLGEGDAVLRRSAERVTAAEVIEKLPEREREILQLRFFDAMSQTEIAEQLGISQMHVSRILRNTLQQLRAEVNAP